MKNKFLPLLFVLASYGAYSQVGIGTLKPDASAQLEVVASDKGILIPRVPLTGSTDATTIKNKNVDSLLVFNTETTSDVTPGYYYWYIDKWYRLLVSGEETITTLVYDPIKNTLTYTDENKNSTAINLIKAAETTTTVTPVITIGNKIASYKNEAGTVVDVNETITTVQDVITAKTVNGVTSNIHILRYIDEARNTNEINLTDIIKDSGAIGP
ncbi:hypothetical protein DMA14_00350, partial [Flavobacterium sharifuzzamanii]